jgi:hypothetical protein
MRFAVAALLVVAVVHAGDGIRPKAKADEYPAHQDITGATIAAMVLTSDQVKKTFGADVGRRFVVVEVAIFPQSNMDVDAGDFRLKGPDGDLARAETAHQVAVTWNEKIPAAGAGPGITTTTETGVIYQSGRDPVTGQKAHATTVYSGVAVTNDPRAQPPPPSGPNPYGVEARLDAFALPEGRIHDPVAGYLYFPKPSKKPKQLDLIYSRASASATLSLPVK